MSIKADLTSNPVVSAVPHRDSAVLIRHRDSRRAEEALAANAVVMVGGMCAGKSTVGRALLNHPGLLGRVEIVERVSTRPARTGDADERIRTVPWAEFKQQVTEGKFALSWRRPLSDGTFIGYGCLPATRGRIPIMMAGHGVYTNFTSVKPDAVIEQALVVGVSAPMPTRQRRLVTRSPDVVDLGPARVEALLAHDDRLMCENVDLVVLNYGRFERDAVRQAVTAITDMVVA